MNAQRIVSDVRSASANVANAIEDAAALVDQVDALGGASAFDAYFAGPGADLDISAAQFSNLLSTLVLFRTLIRGTGTASFAAGHHTNIYTALP